MERNLSRVQMRSDELSLLLQRSPAVLSRSHSHPIQSYLLRDCTDGGLLLYDGERVRQSVKVFCCLSLIRRWFTVIVCDIVTQEVFIRLIVIRHEEVIGGARS